MHNLAIFSWFGYRLPLDQRLALIAEAGFRTTSLWLAPPEELALQGRADEMPELAHQAGLTVENVHAPYTHCNQFWSDDAELRDAVREEYAEAIRFCARHRIPVLVLHTTRRTDPPGTFELGLPPIKDLIAQAESSGVVLAVENTALPEWFDRLMAAFDSPSLQFCYDSSHDFLYGRPPGQILERWGHRLAATHFSDNAGHHDDHWLPGTGCGDWDRVAKSFPSTSYSGSVSLEAVPRNTADMSPQQFLSKAFDCVTALEHTLYGYENRTERSD